MAKKASLGGSRNSASASTSTMTPTKSQMVLRVKSKASKQSKLTPEKKLKAFAFKTKIAKIDAKKPKKPPTAFFYFLKNFRKEFQEQNPGIKSMRDVCLLNLILIGKACGEKWKTMTYEEKVHYYDVATEKRRGFDKAMVDFNKRKEFQEYEDSDFD